MYEYSPMNIRTTINTSEKLSQLNLQIHKIDHQEYLIIDKDVIYH
jgi:hypothetical protein